MAGDTHLITAPALAPPWTLLLEVAGATDDDAWVLVGGLMVHMHALRAEVVASRPTRDVDLLLDITTRQLSEVVSVLLRIGFRPRMPNGAGPLHRFERRDDIVDVMISRERSARWARRPVLQAPGARQAIERRDWYELQTPGGLVRFGVPDQLGAIVAKSAAYTVDQRDRGRHLEDLAVLCASAGSRHALGLDRISGTDRKHLRAAITELEDGGHAAWLVLEQRDRQFGQWVHRALVESL